MMFDLILLLLLLFFNEVYDELNAIDNFKNM